MSSSCPPEPWVSPEPWGWCPGCLFQEGHSITKHFFCRPGRAPGKCVKGSILVAQHLSWEFPTISAYYQQWPSQSLSLSGSQFPCW